jgi:hypothetical protein
MAEKSSATSTSASTGPISKKQAVRNALKSLGRMAPPAKIKEYVKTHHNIEMSTDHISNYKSDILKKHRRKKRAARKAAAMAHAGGAHAKAFAKKKVKARKAAHRPSVAKAGREATFSINDIHAVRSLTGRIGATGLKTLIDELSK